MATYALSPQQKLSAARLAATRITPYFASALLAMVPRVAPDLKTLAVTANWILLWDPEAVNGWTVQQTAAVLVHEVSHLLRQHARRGAAMGVDPEAWNKAADAEINDDLVAMGLQLPGNPVLPKHFNCKDGLTAEEYYRALPADQKKAAPGAGAGEGHCGSGAGHAQAGEPDPNDPQGRSAIDGARVAGQVAEAIRRHVASKGRGSVPGGWVDWADAALEPPKIPWQQKLARHVRAAVAFRPGAVDYRFSRLSRRQAAVGYGPGRPVLPGFVAPVPHVMIAIDTSGSMGQAELAGAVGECQGILAAIGASVDFVSCDAEVHADLKVTSAKQIIANLKGGGGTDFQPVFERAGAKRPRPEVLVFVTDGCGPAPRVPPKGMRVIWLLVGPYKQRPSCAQENERGESVYGAVDYGDFIEIEPGEIAEPAEDP